MRRIAKRVDKVPIKGSTTLVKDESAPGETDDRADMIVIFFWLRKTRCAYKYKGSKTSRFTLARGYAVMQTWQIALKIPLSTASNLILRNSTERRARKRRSPPSGSHLAGGRRAVRRTGLAFQRLGSRPHRPDDLGDGSPRHHSRLLPNRRARAQQSTPLLKLGWTTGARGGSKNKRRGTARIALGPSRETTCA